MMRKVRPKTEDLAYGRTRLKASFVPEITGTCNGTQVSRAPDGTREHGIGVEERLPGGGV